MDMTLSSRPPPQQQQQQQQQPHTFFGRRDSRHAEEDYNVHDSQDSQGHNASRGGAPGRNNTRFRGDQQYGAAGDNARDSLALKLI